MHNQILRDCLREGMVLEVEWDEKFNGPVYLVPGFCKAGFASCTPKGDGIGLTVCTRYNQVDEINSLEELTELAYDWWQKSCNETWPAPPRDWTKLFLKFKLVDKPEIRTVTTWSK